MATGILGSSSLCSCHLLLLHLSSVKHLSRVPLGCAGASLEDKVKKGGAGKEGVRKGCPQAARRKHSGQERLEEAAFGAREGEEGEHQPTVPSLQNQ